jgi:nickel-dependent lactate racemase
MAYFLRYGSESTLRLDLADGALLAECGRPTSPPLKAPTAAATSALAEPLEYPPLARSTTPGDQVCIAIEQGVPRAGEIVAGVVQALVSAGVSADGITVLRTREDAQTGNGDPARWLDGEVAKRITIADHDPSRRDRLGYLAATRSGQAILLNRAIVDADVVLPVGCIHNGWGAWDHGIYGAIFPTFSDNRTLMRYRSPSALNTLGRPKKAVAREVDEVGWLLGVTLTVQVVPGPGDEVLHLVAGEVGAVGRRGRDLYDAAWRWTVPRRASLVIAAVEGGCSCQTWDAVGNALAAAGRLVEEGGAIAICCDLEDQPGPAIEQLRAASSRPAALKHIRNQRPADALAATQLAQAMDRAKVYLLSRLDESVVDDLEIAPIGEPAEVARLAGRHESCILLSNATHAIVMIEDES